MLPAYVQLAKDHPAVKFLKVEIDELQVTGSKHFVCCPCLLFDGI
jgi:hypothetical protein